MTALKIKPSAGKMLSTQPVQNIHLGDDGAAGEVDMVLIPVRLWSRVEGQYDGWRMTKDVHYAFARVAAQASTIVLNPP
jgi:hypothetical protein